MMEQERKKVEQTILMSDSPKLKRTMPEMLLAWILNQRELRMSRS